MFFIPSFASAQIVINEIAWMGAPVDGVETRQWWRYEWVELHNAGEEAVRLDAWKIEVRSAAVDFEVGLFGAIPAQGYFLIGASEKIPGVNVNYANLSGKFANLGQHVILRDSRGNVVEEVDAKEEWFGAGDNEAKLTMERRFAGRPANNPENWGSSERMGGTPKAQNTLFEKERLRPQASSEFGQPKKASFLASLVAAIGNKTFLLAFTLAALLAAGVLFLRHRLIRVAEDAGSSGVRKH